MGAKPKFNRFTEPVVEFTEIAGPRTLKWGTLTLASALAVFLLDLSFAVMLQRFLGAVELIPTSASTLVLGEIRSPQFEATLLLVLGTLRVGTMWVNGFATGVCGVTFDSNQRRDIGRWALTYGKSSIGEFTTLFNDVLVGSAAVASNVFHLASRVVLTLATLVVLGVYTAPVTLGLAAIVILAAPLHRWIDRRINHVAAVQQRSLASAIDRLTSGVKNSLFLRIHGLTTQEERQSRSLIGSYERASRSYYGLASARSAIPQLFAMVVLIAIALAGSLVFGDDRGKIVAYLYLALRLFQNLSDIARVTANTRVNLTRYRILRKWRRQHANVLLEEGTQQQETSDCLPRSDAPVGWRVEGVSFGFEKELPLVNDFSLTIEPGSAVVVVGPSGAGKTTLLLLLAGVLEAQTGHIEVLFPDDPQPISAVRQRLLAEIAYVGPDPFVVPGSLRDFLGFGLPELPTDQEMEDALRLAHCEFALAKGLGYALTEQGEGLSAGQKQRLSLARALLRRPRILLLDEPTANLDVDAEGVLISTLRELKSRCTMVAVTHGRALREIADQIVELVEPDDNPRNKWSART